MLKRRLPRNSLRLVSPLLDNLWSNTLALANYSTYMNAYEHIQRVNAVLRRNLHRHSFIPSERLYSRVSFMTLGQQLEDVRNIQPLLEIQ